MHVFFPTVIAIICMIVMVIMTSGVVQSECSRGREVVLYPPLLQSAKHRYCEGGAAFVPVLMDIHLLQLIEGRCV